MKWFAYPLAVLATCAAFQTRADNPPPGLLAKIQIAPQAHEDGAAAQKREFKDMKKFVRENSQVEPQSKQDNGGSGAKAGDSGNDR